jgi:solute carrier family 35 protein F5
MLLTTPLVVTVGLSLTIPLSLVGQIILQRQYASVLYWIGAAIVFLSFLIVNHESKGHDEKDQMVTVMVPERSEQDVSLDEERWIRSAIPSAPAVIQSRSRLD